MVSLSLTERKNSSFIMSFCWYSQKKKKKSNLSWVTEMACTKSSLTASKWQAGRWRRTHWAGEWKRRERDKEESKQDEKQSLCKNWSSYVNRFENAKRFELTCHAQQKGRNPWKWRDTKRNAVPINQGGTGIPVGMWELAFWSKCPFMRGGDNCFLTEWLFFCAIYRNAVSSYH